MNIPSGIVNTPDRSVNSRLSRYPGDDLPLAKLEPLPAWILALPSITAGVVTGTQGPSFTVEDFQPTLPDVQPTASATGKRALDKIV